SDSTENTSSKFLNEMGIEKIRTVKSSINNYISLLSDLYDNYKHEDDITEKVRAEGRKLEAFFSGGTNARELSINFILHLRMQEKNYMLFRDGNSFNKLKEGLAEINNVTPICYECKPYIKAVNELFSTYRKSESLANRLQETGNGIEETARRMAVIEREKVASFIKQTKKLLLIALLLLCTLGPYFVYKTASYIVAPINRLVGITKKISEGDISLRAPLKEHDETYSLALSFNKMLDNLQVTYASLEKSVELLHEKQAMLVEAQKLASIGTLASGVAHELNNPLNNIYLAAQILNKQIDVEHSPPIVRDTVKDIFSQTVRVKRIVSDLLEFAREKAPRLEDIDIVNIIDEILTKMTSSGVLSNIAVNFDSTSKIIIRADRHLLEQVFINLFSNAADAMESGGLLGIDTVLMDDTVQILVSDTGKGISSEDIPRVFDPFFTMKEKGTGLGLAIVYSIIRKHNGTIEVSSNPGEGTTFTISLPR
ncbi:MAG: ATP-binding protein, partial [Nitrospirota bacterium]|nr:ATP-binding protein [Nitrospirota bacterium]